MSEILEILGGFPEFRVFSFTDAGITILDVTKCIGVQSMVIDSKLVSPRNTQKNIA